MAVLLGNGDGSFQPARNYSVGSDPYSVALGDFRGNGILDIAVANTRSNTVSVLLGNGDGSFQPARSFTTGSGPRSVVVGDFNGDGVLDLAAADYDSGSVSVLLGNGDGSFQDARSFAAGYRPVSVAVGDFNGDAIPDLAVVFSGGVRVLLGNGDGTFQTSAFSYVAGSDPTAVAVGDFRDTGRADLAVANFGSNNVSILLNDGVWPSTRRGAFGPVARHRSRMLPALAGTLMPRPNPSALAPSPGRQTVPAQPAPVAALDDSFLEMPADSFGSAAALPILPRRPTGASEFMDINLSALDGPAEDLYP